MEKKEPEEPRSETASGGRTNVSGFEETAERIETMIRGMPQIEPPVRLLHSVMEAVKTKSVPLWLRTYRWARSPRSFSFTFLHLASAMALCALLACPALFLHESENRNIALNESSGLIPVVFALDMPDARSVHVAGSFNNWVPQPCSLRKDSGSTRWTLTLRLQPGRYEYAFLVDGKHVPHPDAEFYQDDGFGNKNTVLALGKEDDI